MILYRVSNHTDLTGKGGELADGRWHTRQMGRRIVYLSDHPALCLLEMLVHAGMEEEMPDSYQLLSVEVPDRLIESLDLNLLPRDWPADLNATQQIGNQWLNLQNTALLVPSVIVPIAKNCLLNPLARGTAGLKRAILGRFPFDRRLVRQR